jgi:hypothetical protein
VDSLRTERFCRDLILRVQDYRDHAKESRARAEDADNPQAREMYLRRAERQQMLVETAERFLRVHLGSQRDS